MHCWERGGYRQSRVTPPPQNSGQDAGEQVSPHLVWVGKNVGKIQTNRCPSFIYGVDHDSSCEQGWMSVPVIISKERRPENRAEQKRTDGLKASCTQQSHRLSCSLPLLHKQNRLWFTWPPSILKKGVSTRQPSHNFMLLAFNFLV